MGHGPMGEKIITVLERGQRPRVCLIFESQVEVQGGWRWPYYSTPARGRRGVVREAVCDTEEPVRGPLLQTE